MKRIFLFSLLLVSTIGCQAFSPRMGKQQLDNQNAKINGLENNQNALKLEVGRIQNELGINNSTVKEMQQGWANLQATVSRNDNSGVQILQGDGALIIIFATITMAMLFYYVFRSEQYRKASLILAQEMASCNDPNLIHRVRMAAAHTNVKELVHKLTA